MPDFDEKEKFDYKVKKTERDSKIKAKKKELDNLIKDAKQKQYIKSQTDKISSEDTTFEVADKKGKVILSKDIIKFDDTWTNNHISEPVNLEKQDELYGDKDSQDVNNASTKHVINIIKKDVTGNDNTIQKDSKENDIILLPVANKQDPTMFDYLIRKLKAQL